MRNSEISRKTTETDISLKLNLDGTGEAQIETGVGFFDHMLNHVAKHALYDLFVTCQGDLHVDGHHTVEDVGICLGEALRSALGDKAGLVRYGHSIVPMDEALATVAVDLSGRPYLVYSNDLENRRAGDFSLDLVEVFLQALCDRSRMTLNVNVKASNPHHCAEAVFKALGRALRMAVAIEDRTAAIPSTKGALD
jgi:imidazoleglycerol-phosphate dehydratase